MAGFRRAFLIALLVLFLALIALVGGFFQFTQKMKQATVTPDTAHGVVALTGGKDRIGKAFELLKQGKAKRMLITGVNRATKAHELQRLVPGGAQFFPCCVDLGRVALDTRGNAIETSDWAAKNNFMSLIVVTSTYHMPRTLIEFSRAMPGVKLIPYGVTSPNLKLDGWWSHETTRMLLMTEYAKYLNAVVQGFVGSNVSLGSHRDKAQ